MNNEEIDIGEDKPKFVLVEMAQLEKLMQHCFECGKLPGGRSSGGPRNVGWTRSGTKMRTGNLSVVAAAQVAPVLYNDISAFFKALSTPFVSKSSFLSISKSYVWPCVETAYYKQRMDILLSVPSPANICFDGQYDSPGFSAEFCAVTAIEESTKQVIDVQVVHKSEVQNVSARMELAGVKKCLASIEPHTKIASIVMDKHPSVIAYLRNNGYNFLFDIWHRLKSLKKDLRSFSKQLDDEESKKDWKELCQRFIRHVYYSVEQSDGDSDICRELVYSFFLHIQGIHRWQLQNFTDLIKVSDETKVCKRFTTEKFTKVSECRHVQTHVEHVPISSDSGLFQKLLALVAKTTFMGDLDRLKVGHVTSFVESFNSVAIHYRPKRKYFPRKGFEYRTMLAALSFNENRFAEERGDRKVTAVYECFSKSKGDKTIKVKKGPISDDWKSEIVAAAIKMKEEQGPGDPENLEPDKGDEELYIVPDIFDNLLDFDDAEIDFE